MNAGKRGLLGGGALIAQVFAAGAFIGVGGMAVGSCLAGPFTSCTLFRPGRVAENPWDFAVRA